MFQKCSILYKYFYLIQYIYYNLPIFFFFYIPGVIQYNIIIYVWQYCWLFN